MATASTTTKWETKKLGDITENFDRLRKPLNSLQRATMKGEYPYCGANGVVDHVNSYIFDGEYVLLAEDGGYWGGGDNSAYLMKGKFWVNNHAHILKAKDDYTNNRYLWFVLNYLDIDPLIGGDARGKLTQALMNSIEIPLPPKPEQNNIATILSKIQEAIKNQDKIIQTTTELKAALMRKLFSEGLNGEPLKQTEIGKIPKSWEAVELNTICEKPQYGFTASASKKGNVRFLRITDITDDGVNWNTVPFCECPDTSKYLLKDGDIVFARIGATTGKSYLLHNPDNAIFASYLIRVRTKDIRSDYLYNFFQTEAYWNQINAHKKNQLKGGVNGSILSRLLVPKCNDKEQIQIAATFRGIDEKISFAKRKRNILTDLFKSMLSNLMSGETRVNNITL